MECEIQTTKHHITDIGQSDLARVQNLSGLSTHARMHKVSQEYPTLKFLLDTSHETKFKQTLGRLAETLL